MKISRTYLAFGSILGAGLLLAVSAVALPSPSTFGSETDAPAAAPSQPVVTAPVQQPAPAQQPLPPAAPIDQPAGDNAGAVTASAPATQLPSTGDGGYAGGTRAGLGYLLIGMGVAFMGSGSVVWAVSRRHR